PARWYRLDMPARDPQVSIFMLDSNYREDLMSGEDWRQQKKWLAEQLQELRPRDPAKPRRRWVIACAHHPSYTNATVHADDEQLKKDWLPLFEAHELDFYLTGHNHCMEHVWNAESKVTFFVAGGGGAPLYKECKRHPGWFGQEHGFLHLSLRSDRADAAFIG